MRGCLEPQQELGGEGMGKRRDGEEDITPEGVPCRVLSTAGEGEVGVAGWDGNRVWEEG